MCLVLEYWEFGSGKSKIELAEESKIWKVHIDGSTPKTRTLDKYLNINTLPKNPRWREVQKSVDYVLTHCPTNPKTQDQKTALEQLANEFKSKLQSL